MTEARAGQAVREVLRDAGAPVRVTQLVREVLRDAPYPPVRVAQIVREVLRDGPGTVRDALVVREVLRSLRDSPRPVFPVRLFRPPSLYAALAGGAIVGGVSPGRDASIEAMDSGGRWVMEFGEAPLWDRDQVLAWRTFCAACDNGVMPVIVPLWDRLHEAHVQPRYDGASTFGQVVWRWEDPLHQSETIFARLTVIAPAHSTEVTFSLTGAAELAGGEHFSIYGVRYGWRLYRIVRVLEQADGIVTAEIRPPLREWAGVRDPLNFDSPRCAMRCEGDISEVVELLRFGKGVARFVETFNRYP